MILTTTPNIEGKRILEYKGVVFGEVVSGVVFYKDFFKKWPFIWPLMGLYPEMLTRNVIQKCFILFPYHEEYFS